MNPVTNPVSLVAVGDTDAAVIDELAGHRAAVRVVRRCPELAQLLAACQSGLAQVAVVAQFANELTATLVDRLAAVGVSVVAVAATPEEASRLRAIGASAVPEQVTAAGLVEAISAAVEGRRHPGSAGFSVPLPTPDPPRSDDAGPAAAAGHGSSATVGEGDGNPATSADAAPVAVARAGDDTTRGIAEDRGHAKDLTATSATRLNSERWNANRLNAGRVNKEPSGDARQSTNALPPAANSGLVARIARGLPWDLHRRRGRVSGENSQWPLAKGPAGSEPRGTIVAIWGPIGSPGRTTLAVNLAAEQAAAGRSVMLIDADSYGASIAATLGLLDESASFAQACRAADQGGMSAVQLSKTATQVVFAGGSFSLLTGLTRADRWPELRAAAVERVLALTRELAELVIVDCGFALENDEELSYDTVAPRRNAATLATLGQADVVYAVGNSDPIGIPRLIRGLNDLGHVCPAADVRVVVNKVRRKAVGGRPEKALEQAWERFGPGLRISHFLPWDPELTDRALLEGRLLLEIAPDAALSRAIRTLGCAADQQNPKSAVASTTARAGVRR